MKVNRVDLRREITIIRSWFPFLVASVLLAAGAAFVISGLLPKAYEAEVTLIVGQSLSAVNPDYSQVQVSERVSTTYATVATTRPILDAVTDDPELADTMRSLRNQGRDTDGTWLRHVRLGYNYRLDELSAALSVAQIERLAELRRGRSRVAAAYERALDGRDWISLPRAGADEEVDWFVYVVRLHPQIDRDALVGRLGTLGVPSRPYFSPLHLQPLYRSMFGFKPGDFPVIERVAASTLALAFSSRLSDDDVRYVAEVLAEAVDRPGRADS